MMDYLFAYKMHTLRLNYLNSLFFDDSIEKYNFQNTPLNYSIKMIHFEDIINKEIKEKKVKIYGHGKKEKGSILLLGCSFAQGVILEDNQTFGYLLSELTNRNVYRLARGGMGAGNSLFQVSNDKLHEYIKENTTEPDYAIYVYIEYHQNRIYEDKYCFYDFFHTQVGYNQKNGKLVYVKNNLPILLSHFAIGKYIIRRYVEDKIYSNVDYMNSTLKKYFIQIKAELVKRYPNIKIIIIKYPMADQNEDYYNSKIWDELRNEGIIIYDIQKNFKEDFTQHEYQFADGHPNAKAWQIITPKFVENIKL